MNAKGFKKGDWCFSEFQLKQIKKMEDGRITSVSDGSFITGSYDLTDECFPVTMEIKKVSEEFEYWRRKIHELNCNSLNHPEIHRDLVQRWVRICEKIDDKEFVKEQLNFLESFCTEIIKTVKELREQKVGTVRIFK